MAAEQCSALRGRWGRTTVGGSFRLNGFSLNRQPPCVRQQLTPSPAGGRTKRLPRATARAKRSGGRPYGETSFCAVGAGALDSPLSVSRSSDPFRQPPCGGRRLPPPPMGGGKAGRLRLRRPGFPLPASSPGRRARSSPPVRQGRPGFRGSPPAQQGRPGSPWSPPGSPPAPRGSASDGG